jgi:hypothetical protein
MGEDVASQFPFSPLNQIDVGKHTVVLVGFGKLPLGRTDQPSANRTRTRHSMRLEDSHIPKPDECSPATEISWRAKLDDRMASLVSERPTTNKAEPRVTRD